MSDRRPTDHSALADTYVPPAADAGSGAANDGAPSDLVGAVLAGRYRILQRLGEGAMGTVYLGEHLRIGRRDAIKVLRDSLATDAEALARFNRGARNVAAVPHPNICAIYDYSDTAGGLQFIAMEYVPGESLKDLLDREGRLPLARTLAIIGQVAAALQAAHDAGIVHRDLKPGNIMLTVGRDGRDSVRVVDFDLAKSETADAAEVTRFGFVVGTPEYMSPEQLTGDPLDGRSDVYSLALTFVRTLTGVLPIEAKTTQELIVKRLTEPPLPLHALGWQEPEHAALQQVLDRALARDPSGRTPGAAAFAAELEAAAAGPRGTAATPLASAPAAGMHDVLPETRLSPPLPSAPATPAPTPVANAPGAVPLWRRPVVAVAGGAVLLGVLAVALLWPREPAAPVGEPLRQLAESPAAGPPASADAPSVVAADADAARREPGPALPEATQRASDPAVPPGTGAATTLLPEPVPPRAALTAASAAGVLARLSDRLVPPYPSRAARAAIRDTAETVWTLPGVAPAVRGSAAYVVGQVLHSQEDFEECARWLRRAVELRPEDSAARFLLGQCDPEA